MGDVLIFRRPASPTTGGRTVATVQVVSPQNESGETLLITKYVDVQTSRRLSPNTIRLRCFYIKKLAETFPDLTTPTLSQLELWLAAHPRWSTATQQCAVAALRSFYKWAAREGFVTVNPAADLVSVRVHRTPSRIASDDQIRAGLARATRAEQAMILLGAECGFRVSEIAALHESNRDGVWLTIVGKGNVQRSVAATPELCNLLDQLRDQTRWGYYFPGKSGGHAHPSMVWRHIRDVVGVNPHALRHRAGTVVYNRMGNSPRSSARESQRRGLY
jgi:integrase/recombinase XerC